MTGYQSGAQASPYCLQFNRKQLEKFVASSNWRVLQQALNNDLESVAYRARISRPKETFRLLGLAFTTALHNPHEDEIHVQVVFPSQLSQPKIKELFTHLDTILESSPNESVKTTSILPQAAHLPKRKSLAAAIEAFKGLIESAPTWNMDAAASAQKPSESTHAVKIKHGRPGVTLIDM